MQLTYGSTTPLLDIYPQRNDNRYIDNSTVHNSQ